MKRLLLIFGTLCFLAACQKAPELTVTGPSSIELGVDGSSSTITFTANRDWSVRSSDSWVSVSPSSGTASDEAVTVRVSCSANTTYEDRTATITITMEELSQTVSVKQPANLGIILPTQSYNLASDARTIEVEVRSNVQYAVSISESWIKQTGTKGLVTDRLTFSVEENDTYDGRSATITIKPQNATVQEQVITVKQAQKDALIVKDTSFDMPYGGGEIEVKVEANVSFDVKPDEDWIHYVETKALSGSTVRLKVDENPTFSAREGKIEIKLKNGTLSHTLAVKQAGRIAVTSIDLNKTSLRLKEGESETLTATVKPDNATDKTVTWTSSNEGVASIDAAGKISAIKEGIAMITAQAGEKTAKCEVTVYKDIPVSSIELDKTTLSLAAGDVVTLKATVKPDDATDKTVTWNSYDSGIAKVDEEGKVTAIGKGSTTIVATAGNVSASCKVFVKAANYPTPSGAVDLGLSVVWADKNLGASSAYEAGGYYLWGDPTGNGVVMFFDTPNMNYICDTQYDIARAKLGKGWRLPTRDEIKELLSSCTFETVSNGVRLTGPSGKSIVLPLTGMAFPSDGAMGSTSLTSKDKGFLMTGESYSDSYGRFAYVYYVQQGGSYNWESYNAPMAKFPVRPVFESLDGTIPVTSVSLSKTELTLNVGDSETLVATVLPNDATDKTVAWSSSDNDIATVDAYGKVTAIKDGVLTIIAKSGDQSAECKVEVVSYRKGNISFADAKIKGKLVDSFDSNKDGELSYVEAAHVTSLTGVFGEETDFTSFNEFEYFINISSIDGGLFQNWKSLKSIRLPNSIVEIGSSAFENCQSLTGNIAFPHSLKTIGASAFRGCEKIESISLENGVETIGAAAFHGCYNLSGQLVIPDSVISIGSFAFAWATNLTCVTISKSVKRIEDNTFEYCYKLADISIPDGIEYIGKKAFSHCNSLLKVIIPGSVKNFGDGAFEKCYRLESAELLEGITIVGSTMFYQCGKLKKVILPTSLKSIGVWAFQECLELSEAILHEGVEFIDASAFYKCALQEVTIPASVVKFGRSSFQGCEKLSRAIVLAETPPEVESGFMPFGSNTDIYVQKNSLSLYQEAWKESADHIYSL